MRFAGALILTAILASPVRADETISLSVMLIKAEKTGGEVEIDEALKPIAEKLRRAYPEYQKFTLKSGDTQDVGPGGAVSVDDTETESEAAATYNRQEKKRYVLSVKTWLHGKRVHHTVLKSASGQVGFLGAFLDKEHKRVLITAVLPVKAG